MEQRHAFLIMCHHDLPVLEALLGQLDDSRNDLYIHADSKWKSFSEAQVAALVKHARVVFIPRRSVTWGGHSQIALELDLLRAATKTSHSYYHVMSGSDLMLADQDAFHDFFAKNAGKEFIGTDPNSGNFPTHMDRIRYYYPLQQLVGREEGLLQKMQSILLLVQKKLKVDRLKKVGFTVQKGANWCSITHGLAEYVLKQEKFIRKTFFSSVCADELFLQTVAYASPFAPNIVNDSLCYTDWLRGQPYTFHLEDMTELLTCGKLRARKFDSATDGQVVQAIAENMHQNLEK